MAPRTPVKSQDNNEQQSHNTGFRVEVHKKLAPFSLSPPSRPEGSLFAAFVIHYIRTHSRTARLDGKKRPG